MKEVGLRSRKLKFNVVPEETVFCFCLKVHSLQSYFVLKLNQLNLNQNDINTTGL